MYSRTSGDSFFQQGGGIAARWGFFGAWQVRHCTVVFVVLVPTVERVEGKLQVAFLVL
jgi:hypothetical protein